MFEYLWSGVQPSSAFEERSWSAAVREPAHGSVDVALRNKEREPRRVLPVPASRSATA
jgi:hypothetical protein